MARGLINTESDYTYRVKNPVIILDTYDYGKYETYPVSYKLRRLQITPDFSVGMLITICSLFL